LWRRQNKTGIDAENTRRDKHTPDSQTPARTVTQSILTKLTRHCPLQSQFPHLILRWLWVRLQLKDQQLLQEPPNWILAIGIVVDDSLSCYLKFEIRHGRRQHLILRAHVFGPHQAAQFNDLGLL